MRAMKPIKLSRVPSKPPPWQWLIVADLYLADLSTGVFVVSALGDLIACDSFGLVVRIGYWVAFPLALCDLFCLVADLGDPLRFHHMMRVFKLRSPMSTGTWAIGAFCVISFICMIFAALDFPMLRQPRAILAGVGLAPALFVAGYKGVMFSATAQPGWRHARSLGAELVTSAVTMGIAGLLSAALLVPIPGAVPPLRLAQIVMLSLSLLFYLVFLAESGWRIARESPSEVGVFAAILIGAWVVPLILILLGGSEFLVVAASLILVSGILLRYDLVMIPHRLSDPDL